MEAPAVTLSRSLDPELRLQHALDLAFRYLTRRDRTMLEMRRYLEGKRVEPCAIDQALAHLQREDYLNDERFARQFADDKRLLDEWGADRIERRLLALGDDQRERRRAYGVLVRKGYDHELAWEAIRANAGGGSSD